MKRYAAHYIFISQEINKKQHYIELDENSCSCGIFPLTQEISGTEFHNGILFPVAQKKNLLPEQIMQYLVSAQQTYPQASIFELLDRLQITEASEKKVPVFIYQLDGINLLTAEFSTSNGRSNGYIQRF